MAHSACEQCLKPIPYVRGRPRKTCDDPICHRIRRHKRWARNEWKRPGQCVCQWCYVVVGERAQEAR